MSDIWGRIVKLGLTSRYAVITLLTIVLLLWAYLWNLNTSPAGFSPTELSNVHQSASLHSLYNHPINGVHNLFQYGLQKAGYHGLLSMRLVSAVFGLVFIGCFYRIMRVWFGLFIGWISALMLAFMPLVLLAARSATADVMYLAPLAVVAAYFAITHSKKRLKLLFYALAVVTAAALYTPGLIWLFILTLYLFRSTLKKLFQAVGLWQSLAALGLIILIMVPLIHGFVQTPKSLLSWAMLPTALPHVIGALKGIGWMLAGLFWQSAGHNDLQIGRLPLINIGIIALAIFGIYAFWSRARDKAFGLLAAVLLVVVLAGLADTYNFIVLVAAPAVTLAAAGLRYLRLEWQEVFPRNPIPRSLAVILMSLVMALNVLYGVRYSLVAWPHTLAVRQTYVLK